MKILFLDTASKDHSLALCDAAKTLVYTPLEKMGDAELIPAIEKALAEANLTYKDLTQLASAVGPGGFTSLRIGVTAINTLAHTLELPSAGVHLSELWSARVHGPVGARGHAPLQDPHLWLHSTRKTQLFVKGFGEDGKTTPCTLMELADAVNLQGNYVGELIEEHKEALKNCTPIKEVTSPQEILPAFLKNLTYSKQQLLPWYGREG